MAEIKVNKGETKSAFNNLKSGASGLSLSETDLDFGESRLQLINEIEKIENKYNQTIKEYKNVLQDAENDAWTKVKAYFDTDEETSSKMK